MPMKPLKPEKKPPVMKAKGTKGVSSLKYAMTPRSTNITAKNSATPVYCRLR